MRPDDIARQLRHQQEKHKNDIVPTFGLRISDMAGDAANAIEELLHRFSWTSVNDGLPLKPDYDWVVVKVRPKPSPIDGLNNYSIAPHIAELRDDVWYCTECDGPMEEAFDVKVIAWFDPRLLFNYEEPWSKRK